MTGQRLPKLFEHDRHGHLQNQNLRVQTGVLNEIHDRGSGHAAAAVR